MEVEALAPFHPAIVHTPIALIIVGAIFELTVPASPTSDLAGGVSGAVETHELLGATR